MTTLAFATSGENCSVALVEHGRVRAAATFQHEMRLLERLMPVTSQVLADANATLRDVDLFAVDLGPGSFTGIRIGVTTAKSLAWACARPAVGVSSLECVAAASGNVDVLAIVRARPGMVYVQAFGADDPMRAGHPALAPMASLADCVAGSAPQVAHVAYAPGTDVEALRAVLALRPSVTIPDAPIAHDAVVVARLALTRLDGAGSTDPMALVPLYVAEPLIGAPATRSSVAGSSVSGR